MAGSIAATRSRQVIPGWEVRLLRSSLSCMANSIDRRRQGNELLNRLRKRGWFVGSTETKRRTCKSLKRVCVRTSDAYGTPPRRAECATAPTPSVPRAYLFPTHSQQGVPVFPPASQDKARRTLWSAPSIVVVTL